MPSHRSSPAALWRAFIVNHEAAGASPEAFIEF
jgi:hypothetical protein